MKGSQTYNSVSKMRSGSQIAFEMPNGKPENEEFPALGRQRRCPRGALTRISNTEALIIKVGCDKNSYADKLRRIMELQEELESKNIEIDTVKWSRQG